MRHYGSRMRAAGVLVAAVLLSGVAPPPESPVADAAMRGDVELVRSLLEGGADVNAAQGDGMTALHWAAENGDPALAEMLIYAGANVEAVTRLGDYTPLHLASKGGHAAVARLLLGADSDPNAVTTNGATPLHYAAESGDVSTVAALLDQGVDVNAREAAWAQTPLMWAASYGRVEATRVLLERGADPAIATRVIDLAARAAADEVARERREKVLATFRAEYEAKNPNGLWRPSPTQVQAALEAARQLEPAPTDEAVAEHETEEAPEPPSYAELVGSKGGLTALLHAVRQGHLQTVLALLEGGADINQVSRGDHTSPLLMATLNGHFDLALELLERGADPNLASDAGATPLYAAINTKWAPKTRYPQQQAYKQQKATYLDVMEALLEAGADPNVRLTKHLWYLEYTFEQLSVNTKGSTPFWRAAHATDVDAMKLLVAYGADPNIPTVKPPERDRGEEEEDAKDPSGLPPVSPGGPGVWPIHAASGVGHGGGDGSGRAGNSHRHVPDGWLPAVKYLVEELGADVNVRDHNGYTALHWAAARGDNELVYYLVEHGADVTAVSREGQTTVDMANGPVQRIQPFPATIELLESLGSKNNHNCLSC